MNTAGFDCVIEVAEGLLNRSLSAAYHLTDLSKLASGKVGRFDYEIELQEPPTIQLLATKISIGGKIQPATDKKIRIDLCAAIRLRALGFWFRFELIASAIGLPRYDPASQKLKLDAKSISIPDIKIENQTGWLQIFSLRIDLPNSVLNWFNTVLKTVIHAGLLDRYETIDLATLYQDLPDMPAGDAYKLPIETKAIKILTPGVLAMAVNIFDHTGGDAGQIRHFSGQSDIGTSISDAALLQVFNFWWVNTTWLKQYSEHGEKIVEKFKELDKILSTINGAGIDLDCLVVWDIKITFDEKPNINLTNDGRVTIPNWKLDIDATMTAKIRLKLDLPVNPLGDVVGDVIGGVVGDVIGGVVDPIGNVVDPIVKANDWTWEKVDLISIPAFTAKGPFDIQNVVAKLDLDEEYRLRLKVVKGEVNLDGLKWYGACAAILSAFSNVHIEKCTFALSPGLDTIPIRAAKDIVTQIQQPELVWDDLELTLRAGFLYTDMPKRVPSTPRFIAIYNKSHPAQSQVHRSACPLVGKAAEKEKIGYYTLFDAFEDGCSGCHTCHTDIHGLTLAEKQEIAQEFEPFEHATPIHR